MVPAGGEGELKTGEGFVGVVVGVVGVVIGVGLTTGIESI